MKPPDDPLNPEMEGDSGLWTVPNLISALRIAAIPAFLWVLLGLDRPGWSAILLGVIACTDFLDGMAARRLGQVSQIGKFLDPLADRLVVFSSVIGGLLAGLVPSWLGWPLVGREVLIGVASLYLLARLKLKVEVRQMGKVATGFVFTAIPFYYMAGTGFFPGFWRSTGAVVGVVGLILYAMVTWQYLGDMRTALRSSLDSSCFPTNPP